MSINDVNDKFIESVIYRRVAPFLLVAALVLAIVAAVGTYVNDRAIDRSNTERLAAQGELLDCFDDFATSLAGGLPPVREASAKRDAKLAAAAASLQEALVRLARNEAGPNDIQAVVTALSEYQAANRNLEQVRDANPYPEAPSTFCSADLN